MVSSPPITMGGLTSFRAKNVGGRNFVFPSHGGLRLSGGLPIIMGGLSILIVYHYAISTEVDQKNYVYQYCQSK